MHLPVRSQQQKKPERSRTELVVLRLGFQWHCTS